MTPREDDTYSPLHDDEAEAEQDAAAKPDSPVAEDVDPHGHPSVLEAAQGTADAKRAISSIKYQVGTAGRKVGQEAVQIHGGMGVSWDVDIAHYFKRLTTIDQVFGNADWHLDRLAG